MKLQMLYNFLLIGSSLLVWVFMTAAKHAEYDTNYVFFASAVLISLLATLFIILAAIFKRHLVKASALITILFIITSSPLGIYFLLELAGFKMKS
jgi:hypothetical protein